MDKYVRFTIEWDSMVTLTEVGIVRSHFRKTTQNGYWSEGLVYHCSFSALRLFFLRRRPQRGNVLEAMKERTTNGTLFSREGNSAMQGHRLNLIKPIATETIRTKLFTCTVINHWSMLLAEVTEISTLTNLKMIDILWPHVLLDWSWTMKERLAVIATECLLIIVSWFLGFSKFSIYLDLWVMIEPTGYKAILNLNVALRRQSQYAPCLLTATKDQKKQKDPMRSKHSKTWESPSAKC